ncbi:MAG: FAD-dependent oxidoreductase, partial [Verrucomicrobia bacterium]|nr:FAD-dependent oxidoreductase [Verrucomicrobiota bacterium]
MKIIGGGIVGLLEAYTTYQDAQKENKECFISIYDKGLSFDIGQQGGPSTNTTYNLVPSLAPDEILGLVPCGSELTKKLAIPYYQSEGIRIDDVPGVNDSPSAIHFKDMTTSYENDPNHEDRSLALITLGKMSMDLWKKLYEEGDLEIQDILKSSNLNLCKEPNDPSIKTLHDGYRIDLIYDTLEAKEKADSMIADYTEMGYLHCAILSPQEVMAIDPELTNFCQEHATLDDQGNFVWHTDAVALWRPGGCIDTRSFLPKMASYLKRKMGDSFHFYFNKEITQVFVENNKITHLQYKDGSLEKEEECTYIFCPGESVGTLERLGFQEPAYAAFAGSSLTLHIPLTKEEKEVHKNFSHCMEIIGDGIMLAWQARCKEDSLFIGVGGAKAFYGDKQPHINEDFAKNRNLLQLNKVNDILSHFLSLAFGYNTKG